MPNDSVTHNDEFLCERQSLEERLRDNALLVEVTIPAQRKP
jgi:hypothetical protein